MAHPKSTQASEIEAAHVARPMFSSLPAMFMKEATALRPSALDRVRVLVDGHAAVARTARSIFPVADEANDEPTADLLTQRPAVHEQSAWKRRALLET